MLLIAPAAQAQDGDGAPGVIVNYDVLNNLGQTPVIAGIPRRAPALLPPPSEAPRSKLLVAPRRPVVAKAPAEPAPPTREAPAEPAPEATGSAAPAEDLAAVQEVLPARLVSDPVPAVDDPNLAVQPPPEIPPPPAPAPPEPAESALEPPPDPVESALEPPPDPVESALEPPPPDESALEPPPPPPPSLPEVAAPPPEPPAVASKPAEAPQVAARAPARLVEGPLRLLFDEGSTDLSEGAKGELTALSQDLLADAQRRVQLRSYAVGGEQSGRNARRLSLSRALAVRAFLVDKGVSTSRIDVRALGTKFEDGPPDRVDIVDVDR